MSHDQPLATVASAATLTTSSTSSTSSSTCSKMVHQACERNYSPQQKPPSPGSRLPSSSSTAATSASSSSSPTTSSAAMTTVPRLIASVRTTIATAAAVLVLVALTLAAFARPERTIRAAAAARSLLVRPSQQALREQQPQQFLRLLPGATVRFLSLGDWGRNGTHNQSLVAQQLGNAASVLRPQLILSTGDNFYEKGLAHVDAEEFEDSFTNVYTHHSLRDVPWQAVLGNHDYYGDVLAQLHPKLRAKDPRWNCVRSKRIVLPLSNLQLSSQQQQRGRWQQRRLLQAKLSAEGEAADDGAVEEVLMGRGSLPIQPALPFEDPADGTPPESTAEEANSVGGTDGEGEEAAASAVLEEASVELFLYDTTPLVRRYRLKKGHHLDWRGIDTSDWTAYELQAIHELEDWLRASTATWKIVVGHHPVYSFGSHGSQPEMMASIHPLLRKYKVDVYMNGHDHDLQHIKRDDSPVHFVTTGGGSKAWRDPIPAPSSAKDGLQFFWPGQGFTAVQATTSDLLIDFVDVGGRVLHSIKLHKGPATV